MSNVPLQSIHAFLECERKSEKEKEHERKSRREKERKIAERLTPERVTARKSGRAKKHKRK